MPDWHKEFYSLPEIYEIAFSYRDVSRECDFLAGVYHIATGREPASVLELACGPGEHVREFRRRGLRVAALDLSPEMIAHLRTRLGEEPAELLVADMAEFSLSRPVDLAFTLIDSLSYLTSNAQLVSHLQCVRRALNPGGVYVVELRHPRDVWFPGPVRSTINVWTIERDGVRVTTEWGAAVEHDPIAQIERVLTRITVERGASERVIESWGILRPLLPQEFLALTALAGGFRFAGWWGDFDLSRPLGGSDRDWRMIIALQGS